MTRSSDLPTTEDLLRQEEAKIRKLQIIFGCWWPHYAVPYELRWTLWAERKSCPYCATPLGAPALTPESESSERAAHIDHMDPLSRGGEESFRNALYVCARCNAAKGHRLFVTWLARLSEPHRSLARTIYTEKHGHAPEAFMPGPRQPRLTLGRSELAFEESVLKRIFPQPIVGGPPRRQP